MEKKELWFELFFVMENWIPKIHCSLSASSLSISLLSNVVFFTLYVLFLSMCNYFFSISLLCNSTFFSPWNSIYQILLFFCVSLFSILHEILYTKFYFSTVYLYFLFSIKFYIPYSTSLPCSSIFYSPKFLYTIFYIVYLLLYCVTLVFVKFYST